MSVLDLRKLHRLHQIDVALLEIKKRAAALDPGREIQAEMAKVQAFLETQGGQLKTAQAEIADLELRNQGLQAKLKKIADEVYGGKVVSAREIENLEKDKQQTESQIRTNEERELVLMETVGPLEEKVKKANQLMAQLKQKLVAHQKGVLLEKAELEAEFKQQAALRGPAAKEVPETMLSRYEVARQKYGGQGMADVHKGSCTACGTNLPTKTIESAKEGKLVTCEACHRYLYATDGLI